MTLFNPLFLVAGVLAVAAPIVIHLLNQRKFERVPFAAMRFLRASVEQNHRRMKLEDMLLLLVRISLLLLVGLTLSRPTVRSVASGLFGKTRVTAVLLLDNSYSMSGTDGVSSRFERAKRLAIDTIDALPAGSSVAVYLASDVAQPVISQPTADLNFARQSIAAAAMSDRASHWASPIQIALNALGQPTPDRRELYIFTDGQANGFAPLDSVISLLASAKPRIVTHLVLTGPPPSANLGISDLSMDATIPTVGTQGIFYCQVTNFGQATATHVPVSLRLDDQAASDEGILETILPGQSAIATLSVKLDKAGVHTVTAALLRDRLPADDSRSLAFRLLSGVRVLLVNGLAAARPQDAETYYLKQALMPVASGAAGNYPVQCISIDAADLSTARFGDFDAVVLADVPDLESTTATSLARFVLGGGGLVVFPGPETLTNFYNHELTDQAHLLPAHLGLLTDSADPIAWSLGNNDHPVTRLWNDPANGDLHQVKTSRWFHLEPINTPDGKPPQRLLDFSNGEPAIYQQTVGAGCVTLFASSLRTEWNNMAVAAQGGIFPPLMYRLIGYAIQRRDSTFNARVGQAWNIAVPADWAGQLATIAQVVPTSSRRLSANIVLNANGLPTLAFPETDHAGVFAISAPAATEKLRVAIACDPAESSVDALNREQLEQLADACIVVGAEDNLRQRVDQSRLGHEWWPMLGVAAVGLALAETFMAERFSRAK